MEIPINNLSLLRSKIKSILKEWYDEEYFAGPDKMGHFNPEDSTQVEELYTLLSQDGIPDIYDVYPKWAIDTLNHDGYIQENHEDYNWYFTQDGLNAFPHVEVLQNYLKEEGGYTHPKILSRGHDSEAPFLRGNETDGG